MKRGILPILKGKKVLFSEKKVVLSLVVILLLALPTFAVANTDALQQVVAQIQESFVQENSEDTATAQATSGEAHPADEQRVVMLGGSTGSVFAIRADNTLWGWGNNNYGVLGQGHTGYNPHNIPVQITANNGSTNQWQFIASANPNGQTSSTHAAAAICMDGHLYTWGYNRSGILGHGDGQNRDVPARVTGGASSWREVGIHTTHMIAIDSDNNLWSWGGTRLTPQLLNGGAGQGNWRTMYQGAGQVVLCSDGRMWEVTSPTMVRSARQGVYSVVAASFVNGVGDNANSIGVRTDGTLWSIGWNSEYSQVGDRNDWVTASKSLSSHSAIDAAGNLYTWGATSSGQLGRAGTGEEPGRVTEGTASWQKARGLNNLFVATGTDGSLWAWGAMFRAELGRGTGYATLANNTRPYRIAASVASPTYSNWTSSGRSDAVAPNRGAVNVAMNTNTLTVNFCRPMRTDAASLGAITLNNGASVDVSQGTWTAGRTGENTVFTAPLTLAAYNTLHTATVEGFIDAQFGLRGSNEMHPWTWTFTTGERLPDPFTVTQVMPEGTGVAVDTENLVITFSEPVNTTTGTRSVTIAGAELNHTFDVASAVVPVSEPGFWNAERTVLTLSMPEVLEFATEYTVNITGFVAVEGGALVPHTHVFTTESQQVIPEGDFTKTLTLPEGTTIPSPSFTFNFTAQQVVLDDTVTPNISSRPSADFATLLANQTITLNAADAITENGTTTITGTLDIAQILSNLTFPGGGVYVWNVSEVANSSNTTAPSHMSYDDTLFQIRAWVNRYGDLEYIAIHNLERGEGSIIIDLGKTEDGINFFNTYMRQTGTEDNPALEVSKEVTGDMADLNTLFNFTLTLEGHTLAPITNTPPATLPTTHFTARIVNSEGTVVDRVITITPGANNTYTLTFQLRHGETLQIPTLPAGTTFTTTEAAHPEFSPAATITLGGLQLEADYQEEVNTALTTGSHIMRDTGSNSADFTNDHFSSPHTGLVITNSTPLAIIAGLALLIVVSLALRNRRRIEQMPI